MKKFFLIPFLLLGLYPILNLEASQNELKEDIKNWFRNDYWMYEKYSDSMKIFCKVQKELSENPQDIDCNKKESSAIEQYDSDFFRKARCQGFFETDFKSIKNNKIRKEIISDCKRIYNTYKDDEKFDEEGFSSLWISFVLDKELPFYEGNYKNGLRDGFGKLYTTSGSYIGGFRKGIFHGKGILKTNSGNSYEGDWVDNKKHGKGIFKWKSGSSYEGDWVDGNKHGKGRYKWASGALYEGDFVNDKRHGKGRYKWENGDLYEGDFVDGNRHGDGTATYKNGSFYKGQWQDDYQNGLGTETDSKGKKYFGYFVNDLMHGKGVEYNKNGKILRQGIWDKSSLLVPLKVNLKDLIKIEDSSKFIAQNNHETCLKAADYKGCMEYKSGVGNTNKNNSISGNIRNDKFNKIDCIERICSPEKAMKYGTDNLGMKVIPGYSFTDNPIKRSANYFSSPFKLNVNGNFGRYVHIQRVVRYYSRGYSGSLTTIPGIGEGSYPTISYYPGKAPGIRQIVIHNVFDCEDKTFARFDGSRSDKITFVTTKSGKDKKKWISFDDVAPGASFNRGKLACNKSKNYINSLKVSPFDKFHKKELKSTPKNKNPKINCNSNVWKNKPICN